MRQLVQNLVSNSIKFRKPNQKPKIEIYEKKSSNKNGFVTLVFKDDGIGFDEKYRVKIFNSFQRLHGKNKYQGSGVGLAVVKKIVTRHMGKIEVRSKPNQGAKFEVTLPAKQS